MRHRSQTHGNADAVSPVIGVILMVAITVILAAVIGTFVLGLGDDVRNTPQAGIDTDQQQGELGITIINGGNLDSAQLISPTGTKSSVLNEGLSTGAKLTIRSNSSVYTFVDNNNVSILDISQNRVFLDEPGDVPSANLNTLQEFGPSAGSTADEYTEEAAYLACLFNHGGFEVAGEEIPSTLSIPCHSPVLAQSDSVSAGTTGTTPGSTVPILLEEGEYQLLGSVDGDESVVTSVEFER